MLLLQRALRKNLFAPLLSISWSSTSAAVLTPELEAKIMRTKDAYERTVDGKFVGDVSKADLLNLTKMRGSPGLCACPTISTLRLELAISRNQWFLMPAEANDRPTWIMGRHVFSDTAYLGKVAMRLPFGAVPKLAPDLWFTPYWNAELNELRFRLRNGRDLDHAIPLARLGNKGTRPLARLAVAEGLIQGFDETYKRRGGEDRLYIRAYNQDVQKGFQGSIDEWRGIHTTGRSASTKIKTLIYEKGKESGQIFVPTKGTASSKRRVSLGGVSLGAVSLRPPQPSEFHVPDGYCLDFDAKSQTLRYRKLSGEIIPTPTYTLIQLARHHRPILELAKAEGLIDSIPADGFLSSFDLDTTRRNGYFALPPHGSIRSRRTWQRVQIHLGNGEHDFLGIRVPSSWLFQPRLIPYIDAEEKLRIRNIDTETDLEIVKGVYHRNADEIRSLSQRSLHTRRAWVTGRTHSDTYPGATGVMACAVRSYGFP